MASLKHVLYYHIQLHRIHQLQLQRAAFYMYSYEHCIIFRNLHSLQYFFAKICYLAAIGDIMLNYKHEQYRIQCISCSYTYSHHSIRYLLKSEHAYQFYTSTIHYLKLVYDPPSLFTSLHSGENMNITPSYKKITKLT